MPAHITLHYPNPTTIDLGGKSQYAALIHPISHRSAIKKIEMGLRVYIRNAIQTNMGDIPFRPELLDQIDVIIKEALGRLRIIRIKARYKNWALALQSLNYPPSGAGTNMDGIKGGMDLVVCDGFGDGFYPDRHAHERLQGPKRKIPGIRAAEDVGIGDVMNSIKTLREQMGSVIVLSIQGIWVRSISRLISSCLLYEVMRLDDLIMGIIQ